jgi:hypothetical protein
LNIDTNGGQGVGPDVAGHNFPFVNPSPDIAGVLADFYLSYTGVVTLPLTLAWLSGADVAYNGGTPGATVVGTGPDYTPTHAADVVVVDATGTIVFDSTTATTFKQVAFSNRLHCYEWGNETSVCRLTQHIAGPTIADFSPRPAIIKAANGTLDERCSESIPIHLASLNGIAGPLRLKAGFNMVLTPGTPEVVNYRTVTPIVIDVIPGAGLGRYSDCDDDIEPPILTLNNVPPDAAGNIMLGADGCTWVRPISDVTTVPATIQPHALAIGDDCGPCCKCEDYTRVALALVAAFDALLEIGVEAQQAACRFQGEIDSWYAQKACREDRSIQLAAIPFGAAGKCLSDVVLTLTTSATVDATVTPIAKTVVVTDGSGGIALGTPSLSPGGLALSWANVPPRTAISARFRMHVDLPDDTTATDVTIEASATAGGDALPGSASTTTTVTPGSF